MAIAAPGVGNGRAFYTLAVLSLVCILNYYDRNLIAILLEPISRDLHMSDSQLGMVTGMAFALVYSIAAVPIARLADRFGRKRILVIALSVWSLMTGACGLAGSFAALALARFGVGLGEAGGLPTTHALVAEHFSIKWRGRALAIIAGASTFGLALGSAGGGFISDRWGWRAAFFSGCVPGLALAVLLMFTIREAGAGRHPAADRGPGFMAAARILLRRRAFAWLGLGIAFASIADYAQNSWLPSYLIRSFDRSAGEVGAYYSSVAMVANLAGVFLGGMLGDVAARRDARWPLWIAALSFGAAFPLLNGVIAMRSFDTAIAMILPMQFLGTLYIAPIYALVQRLSGDRLRATGAALFMVASNLVGLGFGPTLAGWLSDRLSQQLGQPSLGLALTLTSGFYLVGAACFLVGARSVARDVLEADCDT